jgi:hypothetical protein
MVKLILVFTCGCWMHGLAMAQTAAEIGSGKAASTEAKFRTPDGRPDLQGLWDYSTITPLERPAELAGKARFQDQKEAAEWASGSWARFFRSLPKDSVKDYDVGWLDRGKVIKTLRTSLIIDPADGKLPPLTEEAKKRMAAGDAQLKGHELDGPENLGLQARCLSIVGSGAPILSSVYDNLLRVVQSPGFVSMETEMNHETRVIRLDGQPHLPPQIRLWQGDSRGHWEGDTLVVETTNFVTLTVGSRSAFQPLSEKTAYRGTSRDLKLTERFRLLDADTLLYQFTVDDPTTFVRPWTAELAASRAAGPLLEYACHEGNYSMTGVLAGARAQGK